MLDTEVTDYAVKSKKGKVQEQVLDTAVEVKQNVAYVKAAVVKVIMVVSLILKEL